MISLDFLHEDLERAVARLPRRVAYPLIVVFSVLLWSAIGIVAAAIVAPYLQ